MVWHYGNTLEILMELQTVWLILGALLVVATLLGFVWQNRQGLVSRTPRLALPPDIPAELIDQTTKFTLLQFSGPFCSYCDAMRGVLSQAAHDHEGVVSHREIDITDFADLTRTLRIAQTPTTLIVTHTGHIVTTIRGATKPPIIDQEIRTAIATRKAESDEYLI